MTLAPFKYIYRLVHHKNVEHILRNGICNKNHRLADPNYINIGHKQLISDRNNVPVIDPPGGTLSDYIPFYFAGHSPMLYNICTGYGSVDKYPQSDLIYICCLLNSVVESKLEWFFTDGNAKNAITSSYNHIDNLNRLDWDVISSNNWGAVYGQDRQRRKMSEFLVKDYIPVKYIQGIIVKNQTMNEFVSAVLAQLGLKIPVYIDSNNLFYYPNYD